MYQVHIFKVLLLGSVINRDGIEIVGWKYRVQSYLRVPLQLPKIEYVGISKFIRKVPKFKVCRSHRMLEIVMARNDMSHQHRGIDQIKRP